MTKVTQRRSDSSACSARTPPSGRRGVLSQSARPAFGRKAHHGEALGEVLQACELHLVVEVFGLVGACEQHVAEQLFALAGAVEEGERAGGGPEAVAHGGGCGGVVALGEGEEQHAAGRKEHEGEGAPRQFQAGGGGKALPRRGEEGGLELGQARGPGGG